MSDEIKESPQIPPVIQVHSLPEYLDAMEKVVSDCKERYAHEFQANTELGQLFDKLAEAWRPKDRPLTEAEQLRLVFLFAVKNQLYGGVFSLLRLRTLDAMNGTRFAIEATGIAHLLWKKPSLLQTYVSAYPNIGRDGVPNKWKPSKEYKETFRTAELFASLESSLPDLGKRLSEAYAIICYRASHAGPGILLNLKNRDGKIFYHSNELDQTIIDRAWAVLAVYYFDMARVFFEMLKEQITPENSSAWSQDMELWRRTFGVPLAREARARREPDESR